MNRENLSKVVEALHIKVSHQWKDWLMAPCPFAPWTHGRGRDSHPSFGVKINPEGFSGYHCFTCKRRGRIAGLVRSLEHFREEDYGKLAMQADMAESDVVPEDFEKSPNKDESPDPPLDESIFANLYPPAWGEKPAKDYLKSRGIGKWSTDQLGILYDPEDRRILFPVRDRKGRLFGFSGRTLLVSELYPYDRYPKVKDYNGLKKERHLLGEEFLDGVKPVALVEGLFAYAHFWNLGMGTRAIPVASLGSFLSDRQVAILSENGTPVYLFYDGDAAGDDGVYGIRDASGYLKMEGAGAKLERELPTFLPMYPEGKDDPDQLTIEDLDEMMEEAEIFIDN